MKRLLITLGMMAGLLTWRLSTDASEEGWLTSLEEATQIAQKEGKDILVAHFTLLDTRLRGVTDETRKPEVIPQKGGPPLVGG